MDGFDADVLIYAASPDHPLGRPIKDLFQSSSSTQEDTVGIGSVLLLPEVLIKPTRVAPDQLESLLALLARLELMPVDLSTSRMATVLGARYGLDALDAIHLATAVAAGAERFITNNTKDFRKSIAEIYITYPSDLLVA